MQKSNSLSVKEKLLTSNIHNYHINFGSAGYGGQKALINTVKVHSVLMHLPCNGSHVRSVLTFITMYYIIKNLLIQPPQEYG